MKRSTNWLNIQVNVKKLITIFFIIIALTNVFLWYSYVDHQKLTSTQEEEKIPTVWGYLNSDSFKGITGGLSIPIVLFLVEYVFRIKENYEKSRFERLQSRLKDSMEKRIGIINDTSKMWNNLFELGSQVISFDKNNTRKERLELTDIEFKLRKFSNDAEDVVNSWDYRMPNISLVQINYILAHINFLLSSIESVISTMKEDLKKNKDISEIQNQLIFVQDGIKTNLHHSMLSVLKDSMFLLEICERYEIDHKIDWNVFPDKRIEKLLDDKIQREREKQRKEEIEHDRDKAIKYLGTIDSSFNTLFTNSKSFFDCYKNTWKLIPKSKSEEVNNLRLAYDNIVTKMTEYNEKNINEFYKTKEWKDYNVIIDNLSDDEVTNDIVFFTKDDIKNIALWFARKRYLAYPSLERFSSRKHKDKSKK